MLTVFKTIHEFDKRIEARAEHAPNLDVHIIPDTDGKNVAYRAKKARRKNKKLERFFYIVHVGVRLCFIVTGIRYTVLIQNSLKRSCQAVIDYSFICDDKHRFNLFLFLIENIP